jgi:hypothetical protein
LIIPLPSRGLPFRHRHKTQDVTAVVATVTTHGFQHQRNKKKPLENSLIPGTEGFVGVATRAAELAEAKSPRRGRSRGGHKSSGSNEYDNPAARGKLR